MNSPRRPALDATERAWWIAIVTIAAAIRLQLNDVASFSPADESIYVELTSRLLGDGYFAGYGALVSEWLGNPRWWVYPNPLRFGYLAITTVASGVAGAADARVLATLSTLAGIAVIPLLFSVARRLVPTKTALLAAAFAAVSPLELALGRRALQDEVFCAAVLLAMRSVIWLCDGERRPFLRVTAAIATLTLALSVKETFAFLYPAFALFILWYARPFRRALRVSTVLVPPLLLWWAAFSALARDATAMFRVGHLVRSAMSAEYVIQYQSGPPHRLLLDMLAISPLVTLLVVIAVVLSWSGLRADRGIRSLTLFVACGWIALSLIPSKNLRFAVMLDPQIRLLAAWGATASRRQARAAAVAIGAANAAIEIELFREVFIRGGVYDPVTQSLLEALGALPRDASAVPSPSYWPWVCAAIAAVYWLYGHRAAVFDRWHALRRARAPSRDGFIQAAR